MTDLATIERVLAYSRWAVVGCSDNPWRSSHSVAEFLIERGYDVVPVNQQITEVFGRPCYPSLAAIPKPVDVVDLFRRSEYVAAHVEEAIAAGAKAVWTQLGVIDEAAAARAHAAGLDVVMNRCPARELPLLRARRSA